MSPASNVSDRAEAVRQKTLATLRSLTEEARAFGLSEPPPGMEQYRQKLEDNTYQVLVVGEAKRGKSTFVNALIGRDILPTDVDIATSQVFRICPAEREAYRLRFEDDSQQAITAADLPRYGSQVVADQEGIPQLDRIIRWIEVDVPVRFLPANVRILDTPGLGALCAGHAEITYRFVPRADAVIFVLESQAPIGDPEVRFVEMLLTVTRNIFFIQTKIDQFREEWQTIQNRNQHILQEQFKGRLPDPRVWPISSTLLQKAAQTGDDDYLMVSRHTELATALKAFLFRVAGWSRSAEAILLAGHYHSQSRSVLATRLDGLQGESKQKRMETQQRAMESRRQFEEDWGERGQKRRELLENVQRAGTLAKQEFRQSLQPSGSIETAQREKIESIRSIDEASKFGQTLGEQLASEASAKWREVCSHLQARYAALLGPFLTSTAVLIAGQMATEDALAVRPCHSPEMADDWWRKVKGARMELIQATWAAGGAVALLSFVITTSWFPPLALGGVVAAQIWGLVKGWKTASAEQIRTARQDLNRHLGARLEEIRKYFFEVDLASGRFSRVEEYFNGSEQIVKERVASMAKQKLVDAQAEISRMADEAKLDDQQRNEKAETTRRQLVEWDGMGHSIEAIEIELQEMDRNNAAFPAVLA